MVWMKNKQAITMKFGPPPQTFLWYPADGSQNTWKGKESNAAFPISIFLRTKAIHTSVNRTLAENKKRSHSAYQHHKGEPLLAMKQDA